jgi:hypothetical protein
MTKESLVSKDQAKVTEAESKNIMDDILGELDDQDEEELEQIAGAGNANFAAANVPIEDDEMAFNKDDQLNMKYNMAVGEL